MDFIFDSNVVAPLSQEASPAAYSAALISPMSSQSYATQQSKNTACLRDSVGKNDNLTWTQTHNHTCAYIQLHIIFTFFIHDIQYSCGYWFQTSSDFPSLGRMIPIHCDLTHEGMTCIQWIPLPCSTRVPFASSISGLVVAVSSALQFVDGLLSLYWTHIEKTSAAGRQCSLCFLKVPMFVQRCECERCSPRSAVVICMRAGPPVIILQAHPIAIGRKTQPLA